MEQESHDMFEEEDDETQISSDDEDDVHEEEQDSQVLENSQEPFEEQTQDELPSLSPNEGPRTKRQRTEYRKYAPLTAEEERKLVEFYQANELLYNKKLSAYRDKQKKKTKCGRSKRSSWGKVLHIWSVG